MKTPKKINPDRIRDSIVQIYFKSDIPFEPLIGYCYSILAGEYSYTNQNTAPPNAYLTTAPISPNDFLNTLGKQHFFNSDKIKIQLAPNNSIVFNCIEKYIGWESYFPIIKDVLTKFFDNKIIKSFNRVGLRYISQFADVDILEKIKFSFELDCLKIPIDNGDFKFEWKEPPYRIILNLASKLPIAAYIEGQEKAKYVSLIDVDVIQQNFETSKIDEIFSLIDTTHTKEKEVFFGLLAKEFLETLSPQY